MKLAEAFLVFGPDSDQSRQFLSTTFTGDSMLIREAPKLLEAYPLGYSPELSDRLSVFALPEGLVLYRKPQTEDITHFVATNTDGGKTYCSCCRISERLSKKQEVYCVKSLVLLSAAPMYTLQRALLEHFRELVSRAPQFRKHQEHMRFRVDYRELLLSSLFTGLPQPSVSEVLVSHYPTQTLSGTRLTEEPFLQYRLQAPLHIPNYQFHVLLQRLRPEHIIDVLHCLLLEMRVVLVCSDEAVLGPAAEALIALLLPFKWKHVFVPYLPGSLLGYLDAPVPYLMGIRKGSAQVGSEQVFVDLDTSLVDVPQELPSLPAPFATHLYKNLSDVTRTANSETWKPEEAWVAASLQTQRVVLTYFLQVLQGFEDYFDSRRVFDEKGFLLSQESFNRSFFEHLFKTQLWAQFLDTTNEEISVFQTEMERMKKSDFLVFRIEQQREIEKMMEEYRRPLRIGLESLFNAFRPEAVFDTNSTPVLARLDSEVVKVSPPEDRLLCGSYWYPLRADLFLDYRRTNSDAEFRVKNLDTGKYESLS